MSKRFIYYNTDTAFVPTDIADLAYWLNADIGINYVSGDVDVWEDQSGNNRDFVYSNGSRPKFSATYGNSKAYVYSDTKGMRLGLAGFTEQFRTVAVLFKGGSASNSTSGSYLGLGTIIFQEAADYAQIGVDSINVIGYGTHYFANPGAPQDIAAIDQNINIVIMVCSNSGTDIYFNGAMLASSLTVTNNNASPHVLFSNYGLGADYTFEGGIRQVLNYNRALNSTEIAQLNAYLLTQA